METIEKLRVATDVGIVDRSLFVLVISFLLALYLISDICMHLFRKRAIRSNNSYEPRESHI